MSVKKAEVLYIGDASSVIRATREAQAANDALVAGTQASATQIIAAQDRIRAAGDRTAASAIKAGASGSKAAALAGRAALDASNAVGESTAQQVAAYRRASDAAIKASQVAVRASQEQSAAADKARAKQAESLAGFVGLVKKGAEGLLGFAGAAVYAASKFQSAMERIHTQAGATQGEVRKMGTAVLGLSLTAEQGPVKLAHALYEIESVGLRGARALGALRSSSELAAVGGADLATASSAVASAMVAWHMGAAQTGRTAATLNAIVGAGKMHMQDLVEAMGTKLPGVADMLGISLHSVGGALAVFTDAGESANTAATNLVTPLFKMAVVTAPKAIAALKGIGLGVHSLADDFRSGGINKAIDDLHKHLVDKFGNTKVGRDLQTTMVATAFGGSKGSAPIMQLLTQVDRLGQRFQLIGQGIGQWSERVAAEHETAAHRIKVAWSVIQSAFVAAGTALLPVVSSMLGGFEKLVLGMKNDTGAGGTLRDAFMTLVAAGKGVVSTVTSIVGWLEKHKTIAVALGGAVAGLAVAITAITFATKAWAVATVILEAALAVNPVVAIGVAITTVAGAVVALELKTHFLETAWRALKDAFAAVTNWIGGAATTAFNAVKWAATNGLLGPVGLIITHWKEIPGFFSGIWTAVVNGISSAAGAIGNAIETIAMIPVNIFKGLFNTLFDLGKYIIKGLVNGIISAGGDALHAVGNLGKGILDTIKSGFGIFSPSRVMFQLGVYLAEGLTNGLLSGREMVAAGLNQAFVYPIDAAIRALEAKKQQLQDMWSKIDARAQRAQLVGAVEAAGGTVSGSGMFTGVRAAAGAGRRSGPLSWAQSMVGHFAESTGQNTGPELDRLEAEFGTRAVAWCAMFATKALVKAGAPRGILTASVGHINQMAATGQNGLRFTSTPRAGELMTFGNSHIGVIEYVRNGIVHTIEGNANDPGGVVRRTHSETSGRFVSVPLGGGGLASMGMKIAANIAKVTKGGKLSANTMRGLLYAAGFRGGDLDTAVAIAMAESGGNPNATNQNSNGTIDRGFMQINSSHGSLSTYDPIANARGAFRIYSQAHGFSPWSTYQSGAYRQYLGGVGSGMGALPGNAGRIMGLRNRLDALHHESLSLPIPARGKAGDSQRLANEKERRKIALERLAIEEKIRALQAGDKHAAMLAKGQNALSAAVQALQQFDMQAKRAAELAKIDIQIKNLERLKAFQDAVQSLKDQMASLAAQAAQTWRTMQEKQINATHDATLKTIANSADAQQLAALRAQDAAAADAQQQQQLQDQLAQAIASGDVKAQQAAQDAIDAYKRQKLEQQLQDNLNAATTAADTAQQTALSGLDQQTQDYQNALQAQLDALVKSLAQRKMNYATWAKEVDAILAQYGLSVATDPTAEGSVDAGPGPAGAPKKGSGGTVGTVKKAPAYGGAWGWGGFRATGGAVQPGYVYRVGEHGPEDVAFGQRGTVMTAEQTRKRDKGGMGANVIINGPVNFNGTRAAKAFADRLAFRAAIGTP